MRNQETARREGAPPPQRHRGRVLVIEDEAGPRESLRLILEDRCVVETATEPEEALARLRDSRFDLITLDLHLPGGDGLSLLPLIREIDPEVEVVAITAYGTIDVAMRLMRQGVSQIITKPFAMREVLQAVDQCMLKRRLHVPSSLMFSGVPDGIPPNVSNRPAPLSTSFRDHHEYLDFVLLFSRTYEANDPYCIGHSERVGRYCRIASDRLGLDDETAHHLEISALLHDIGKVGLPFHRLSRKGPPTLQEWDFIRSHPSRGVDLVRPLGLPQAVYDGIQHHHERFDGTGYPGGLAGSRIPLAARIVHLCDAFDAMVSVRAYRPARSVEQTAMEIRALCGAQFDPALAATFLDIMQSAGEA